MQKTSLISRFLLGFTPQPGPPRGPHGMIGAPPPVALPVINTPSLCEAGPCRNYHRVVSVMETQEPIEGEGDTHLQTTRACYPSPGIEVELGETPIMHCSRWEPDMSEDARLAELRRKFMISAQGKKFSAEVDAFEAELAAERRQLEEPAPAPTPAFTAFPQVPAAPTAKPAAKVAAETLDDIDDDILKELP